MTAVWTVLVAATCVSWVLGATHRAGAVSAIALLAVAFVKVRLIGLHFMEIRGAPMALRVVFEIYVVAVPTALSVLVLTA
ncbi:cytochrome C oxidase subunit IV family protein [Nocardia sp. NEAU-351]|uniref:Cytochrome C oxidase subunit IV family protein n=2 Tax=Nocardia bovistercoris TaxID=2785916 RepID=A0A931I8B9_9NOCA|nr:cytochrome C oxidase subunit IV family protein [Nocardia bovistercoris]MBH0776714.1 cytochrome C oxidase subunit IV family protein [Nocardia bovistercoris]